MITFEEFRDARVKHLCKEPRCPGDHTYTEHDFVGGLFDLISKTNPRSIVEIGAYRGVSTELLLLKCQRVVTIDPWEYPDGIFVEFIERCGAYPNLELYRGESPGELARFGNDFDMCYIDGMHTAAAVTADIIACSRVVKPHGYLAGHDFHMPHVEKAVMALVAEPVEMFKDGSWLTANKLKRY